jgi:hypothetical protein
LIIGNIEDAKIIPDAAWRPRAKESTEQPGQAIAKPSPIPMEVKLEQSEPRDEMQIERAAVTTRAQAEKEKKPMK